MKTLYATLSIKKNNNQSERASERATTRAELIDKAPLLKELAKTKKEALNDCWEYHFHLIKETDGSVKKSELLDYLYDIELKDWEDVGFFVGYLRALDDSVKLLSEAKPQRKVLSAQTRSKIKSTQKLLKKKLAGK